MGRLKVVFAFVFNLVFFQRQCYAQFYIIQTLNLRRSQTETVAVSYKQQSTLPLQRQRRRRRIQSTK